MVQIHLKDKIFERAALMLGVDVIIRSDYRLLMLWHNGMFPMIRDKLFKRAALMYGVDVSIRLNYRPAIGVVASTTPPIDP